jgi:hypothetical protein
VGVISIEEILGIRAEDFFVLKDSKSILAAPQ